MSSFFNPKNTFSLPDSIRKYVPMSTAVRIAIHIVVLKLALFKATSCHARNPSPPPGSSSVGFPGLISHSEQSFHSRRGNKHEQRKRGTVRLDDVFPTGASDGGSSDESLTESEDSNSGDDYDYNDGNNPTIIDSASLEKDEQDDRFLDDDYDSNDAENDGDNIDGDVDNDGNGDTDEDSRLLENLFAATALTPKHSFRESNPNPETRKTPSSVTNARPPKSKDVEALPTFPKDDNREMNPSSQKNNTKQKRQQQQLAMKKSKSAISNDKHSSSTSSSKTQSSSSQPLRTLKKLQAMLDETDYVTSMVSSSSSSSPPLSPSTSLKKSKTVSASSVSNKASTYNSSANADKTITGHSSTLSSEKATPSSLSTDQYDNSYDHKGNSINIVDEKISNNGDGGSSINNKVINTADEKGSEHEMNFQAVEKERFWTSKDRSKYRQQQRKSRAGTSDQNKQRSRWLFQRSKDVNNSSQEEYIAASAFSDASETEDITDDEFKYTVPDYPVYMSDGETSEFDPSPPYQTPPFVPQKEEQQPQQETETFLPKQSMPPQQQGQGHPYQYQNIQNGISAAATDFSTQDQLYPQSQTTPTQQLPQYPPPPPLMNNGNHHTAKSEPTNTHQQQHRQQTPLYAQYPQQQQLFCLKNSCV